MAPLPPLSPPDPTLSAADRELEARARKEPRRDYLGMSAVGHPCERKLWYDVHDPIAEEFSAATLKRFEDGHRSEALMAQRIRMANGVQLWTVDPETGNQFECTDFDGRFKGHMDGVVLGLFQAPKTPHVWEGKAVNEKKFAEFKKIKAQFGEKETLARWDAVYWTQAQSYMGYFDLQRHYLTVCTPGVRDWDSARTEFDSVAFDKIKDKAKRILEAKFPLAKVSNNPSWWQCKFCVYTERCHGA
jgi:hypothetical protein